MGCKQIIEIINTGAQVVLAFSAFVGVCFGLIQNRRKNAFQRAKFFGEIIHSLRFDKDLVKALYLVEYKKDLYKSFFAGHSGNDLTDKISRSKYFCEEEFLVDKLLVCLSYICYLEETNNISRKDMKIFHYVLHRVCVARSVQEYLVHLLDITKRISHEGRPSLWRESDIQCTFHYIINYGKKHKLFEISKDTPYRIVNKEKYPADPLESLIRRRTDKKVYLR